jgi:ribonuclease BN (tRNA processing enzyme)
MQSPYFPLQFSEVSSHISGDGTMTPSDAVIIIHPEGGYRFSKTDELEHIEMKNLRVISFDEKDYCLDDCLVIKMQRTNHPQKTISYRFEERPTGKTVVILTDHENIDGMPRHLGLHLENADLLIMDSQYNRKIYDQETVGFGHGTPDYCMRVAHEVNALRLGFTHHDPLSSDDKVDDILNSARAMASKIDFRGEVFACADYLSLEA